MPAVDVRAQRSGSSPVRLTLIETVHGVVATGYVCLNQEAKDWKGAEVACVGGFVSLNDHLEVKRIIGTWHRCCPKNPAGKPAISEMTRDQVTDERRSMCVVGEDAFVWSVTRLVQLISTQLTADCRFHLSFQLMHQRQLAHQMADRPKNGGQLWSYGGTTPAIRCCVTLSSLSEGKHRGLFE